MNHQATDPAGLAAECQRRFSRHYASDAVGDGPGEYDAGTDLPPRPMTAEAADAALLESLPAGVDYSLSGNVHRYRICGRLEIDTRTCRATVYWTATARREYEAGNWTALVGLVRADVGKAER